MAASVDAGFKTFDGADHYGPAELLMGALRSSFGAEAPKAQYFTKWCPSPRKYSLAEVDAAMKKSCGRMNSPQLDLMQLHWWDYALRGELEEVLRHLETLRVGGIIRELGLTNFDTAHVIWMCDSLKIPVASNQVQFSLVDTRPLASMAPACASRGIKLLCYGVLLGGLLTDKWLGKPEPTRQQLSTPSLGKYFRMIQSWGNWALFQELLIACRRVADRVGGGANIASVAARWVLEQKAVGGVIIGFRAGLSEHLADNKIIFSIQLSKDDCSELLAVSKRGRDLMAVIGDCGDECKLSLILSFLSVFLFSSIPHKLIPIPFFMHVTHAQSKKRRQGLNHFYPLHGMLEFIQIKT